MSFAIKGAEVTVLRPTEARTDPFGAVVEGDAVASLVENVVVDNPSTADVESTVRQFGASCDLTLHFPKGYAEGLRGCRVALPAPWSAEFEVMGDPMPYDSALTPGEHGMTVHVRRVVG